MIRHVRHSLRLFVLLGTLGVFAACESSPTTPVVDPGVTSVTGVNVTSPTTSVAVGATMQMSATVKPAGVSQAVTWNSSDVTRATVNSSGVITGVFPGIVRITAASTADATKSASTDISVTGCVLLQPAAVTAGGTLMQDVCYRAELPLVVNTGTLTVQPGVRVEFGPNAFLSISSNGRLNANGAAAKPIIFTSVDAAGIWRGVRFSDSRSAENVLRYVTIANGGSTGWNGASNSTSALFLDGNSLVNIQNSTISGSRGQGITLYSGAEMTFENNTLQNNALAAWVHPNSAQYVGSSTVFTGNTSNVVRVTFGNNDVVSTAQTWHRLTVPFEIQDRTTFNAALTLEPGVKLVMRQDVELIVNTSGSLTAIGTAALPITLSGTVNITNFWKGLRISSANVNNQFAYVVFENGGSQQWTGAPDSRAMVYLDGSSKALITNSTFRGSGHYGLWVPLGGDISGFSGNTFNTNARAMIVHPEQAGKIAANNVFSGNTENLVRVTFGNSDRVLTAQTWNNFGTPFFVTTRTYVEAALTIAAGVQLEFGQNASLLVTEGGSMRANGTAANNVVFRGGQNLPAYWQGIQYNTANVNNVLTYTSFSNAGSQAWYGGANSTSTIHITRDGAVALANVSFASTGGYAMIVSNGGSLNCANVNLGGFMNYVITNAGGAAQANCII